MLTEVAKKYHSYGLSVIPVGENKKPTVTSWAEKEERLIAPNGEFDNSYGIGIVCGAVSGNLEIIDIDCKYDLTGKLFSDYCDLINSLDITIIPLLLIEKTTKGGYHFIYRCAEIQANTRLAARYTTEDEKLKDPKANSKVLLETRGEGGYVMVYPSPKYDLIEGDFGNIPTITIQQRKILFDSAKSLNQVFKEPIIRKQYQPVIQNSVSCFDDYNQRADVVSLLEEEGWKITRKSGSKYMMLRPGGEGLWSADYCDTRRLFYVFTTSSDFENDKAYNASQVLTILRFGGDYTKSSRWLKDNGYGTQKTPHKRPNSAIEQINIEELITDFTEIDDYLEAVRSGTFQMGMSTGIPALDSFFRLKEGNLVIVNGHDNVGKSVILWYLATLSAINYGWKWVIHAAENKAGGVIRKIVEFKSGRTVYGMEKTELDAHKKWAYAHFTVLSNKDTYTYKTVLEIADKIIATTPRNALLIDPYNSLYRDKDNGMNVHDYDYECLGDIRNWIYTRKCTVFINCHGVTEAARRVYPKGHQYEGHVMPLGKADTEGGSKFPNRADDFITIHRMVHHPSEWMFTEIHVRKIKEMETGGRPTLYEQPFKLKMIEGGIGFIDMDGYNPVSKKTTYQINYNPKDFTEPSENPF